MADNPASEKGGAELDLPRKPAKTVRYMLLFVTDEASRVAMAGVLHDYFMELNQYFSRRVCVIWPMKGKEASRLAAVLAKNWSERQKDLIEDSLPCLLIIDQDGPDFDPEKHKWAVVDLRQLLTREGNIDASFGIPFSEKLIKICNDDQLDLFYYLEDLEFQQKLKKLKQLILIKPGIFGVRFDIKSFIEMIK